MIIGIENANVLPEPVNAMAIMSRPLNATGIPAGLSLQWVQLVAIDAVVAVGSKGTN